MSRAFWKHATIYDLRASESLVGELRAREGGLISQIHVNHGDQGLFGWAVVSAVAFLNFL